MRAAFDAFLAADEVGSVRAAFQSVLDAAAGPGAAESRPPKGLAVYDAIRGRQDALAFRTKRVFAVLDAALDKRQSWEAAGGGGSGGEGSGGSAEQAHVVVSGAGPVGLRSACESALLGHRVTVVEKRATFSRVNILMFWSETMADMVALGAKSFYPELLTHGDVLHMGTREIQLCLLKVALLLGVEVLYESQLEGVRFDAASRRWEAVIVSSGKKSAAAAAPRSSLPRRSLDRLKDALAFKPDKTNDYHSTFTCNMVDEPPVDEHFIRGGAPASGKRSSSSSSDTRDFHALIVAEGEWSQTCRKLGVKKSIDRFARAIGLVVNLQRDPTNAQEKALSSIALGLSPEQNVVRDRLLASGIVVENLEYLQGHTHYIVVTLHKATALLDRGVLKQQQADLLAQTNVQHDKLVLFARELARAVGLPDSAPLCESNAVQLFDFSTRARARKAVYVLSASATEPPGVTEDVPPHHQDSQRAPVDPLSERASCVPVFPVGDALLEPFWPQGLGSNRGFHSAIDAAFAVTVLRNQGLTACLLERTFAYTTMHCQRWSKIGTLQPFEHWTPDPLCRYSMAMLKVAKDLMERHGWEYPPRIADLVT